jgi:hypothetical protein
MKRREFIAGLGADDKRTASTSHVEEHLASNANRSFSRLATALPLTPAQLHGQPFAGLRLAVAA